MDKQWQTIEAKTKQDIDNTIDALEAHIRGTAPHEPTRHAADKTHGRGGGTASPPPSHTAPRYTDPGYQFRQRMVWTTVLVLGIGIFGMWGWHMYSVFYDVSRDTRRQTTPFGAVDEYFSEAMHMAGTEDEDTILPDATSTPQTEPPAQEQAVTTLDSLISKLEGSYSTSTVTTTP